VPPSGGEARGKSCLRVPNHGVAWWGVQGAGSQGPLCWEIWKWPCWEHDLHHHGPMGVGCKPGVTGTFKLQKIVSQQVWAHLRVKKNSHAKQISLQGTPDRNDHAAKRPLIKGMLHIAAAAWLLRDHIAAYKVVHPVQSTPGCCSCMAVARPHTNSNIRHMQAATHGHVQTVQSRAPSTKYAWVLQTRPQPSACVAAGVGAALIASSIPVFIFEEALVEQERDGKEKVVVLVIRCA